MQGDAEKRIAPAGQGPGDSRVETTSRTLESNCSPLALLLHALESATGRAPSHTGKGYRSRCPSCGGKSEKVSATEATNGSVLLHAFCGCQLTVVLGACGLTLGDLFPARLDDPSPDSRRAARQALREAGWRAALEVLEFEAAVVQIVAHEMRDGCALSEDDHARLLVAIDRMANARSVLHGR